MPPGLGYGGRPRMFPQASRSPYGPGTRTMDFRVGRDDVGMPEPLGQRRPQIFTPEDLSFAGTVDAQAGGAPRRRPPAFDLMQDDPREHFLETAVNTYDPRPKVEQNASLGDRISGVLQGAARAGALDPQSEDNVESFLGTGLRTFAAVQDFRAGMSAAQAEEQRKAVESRDVSSVRQSQAELNRARAAAEGRPRVTGGSRSEADLPFEEWQRREAIRQQGRERIEGIRSNRPRITRGTGTTTSSAGRVTPAERAVAGRVSAANRAGASAVAAAERNFAINTPAERDSVLARGRREANPSYAADSAFVENVLGPRLRGDTVPRAPDVPSQLQRPRRPTLFQTPPVVQPRPQGMSSFLESPTGQGTEEPEMGLSVVQRMESTRRPRVQADTGDAETLDATEIEDALASVSDLSDDEAATELAAAGYSDLEIEQILARR